MPCLIAADQKNLFSCYKVRPTHLITMKVSSNLSLHLIVLITVVIFQVNVYSVAEPVGSPGAIQAHFLRILFYLVIRFAFISRRLDLVFTFSMYKGDFFLNRNKLFDRRLSFPPSVSKYTCLIGPHSVGFFIMSWFQGPVGLIQGTSSYINCIGLSSCGSSTDSIYINSTFQVYKDSSSYPGFTFRSAIRSSHYFYGQLRFFLSQFLEQIPKYLYTLRKAGLFLLRSYPILYIHLYGYGCANGPPPIALSNTSG